MLAAAFFSAEHMVHCDNSSDHPENTPIIISFNRKFIRALGVCD